jgi:hypothetical protein
MNVKKLAVVASLSFALISTLGPARLIQAQSDKTPYPTMAPLEQYLMDRDAEIAMARSAAPESISRDATVLVLGRHGYETAVEGKNGFVCAVDRSWMSGFDAKGFWNPKIRGALCYNPPAARSIAPIASMRTRLILEGLPKEEIIARIKAAYAKNELPSLEPGSMAYMLSKQAWLSDREPHSLAHLMIYTPLMDSSTWGADKSDTPVALLSQFRGAPEPIDVFIVATDKWSDGTPAPVM